MQGFGDQGSKAFKTLVVLGAPGLEATRRTPLQMLWRSRDTGAETVPEAGLCRAAPDPHWREVVPFL